MSASQNHGFIVENLLLAEFPRRSKDTLVPNLALDRAYTSRFDVAGYLDPYGLGIPTSIKCAKFRGPRTLVNLADATRIVKLGEEPHMRLMVALYRQDGNQKVFAELREYVVTGEEWSNLCGRVPPEDLEAFAKDLTGRSTDDARGRARVWKKDLATSYPSKMKWNPKIDSGNQRRVQCSVTLHDLESVIADRSRIKVYGQALDRQVRPGYLRPHSERLWGTGLRFPFCIDSPARQRNPRSGSRQAASAASPVKVLVPRKARKASQPAAPAKASVKAPAKRASASRR